MPDPTPPTAPLCWTVTPPSKAGYYRANNGVAIGVVEVAPTPSRGLQVKHDTGHEPLNQYTAWAGPLTPPDGIPREPDPTPPTEEELAAVRRRIDAEFDTLDPPGCDCIVCVARRLLAEEEAASALRAKAKRAESVGARLRRYLDWLESGGPMLEVRAMTVVRDVRNILNGD